MAVHLLKDPVGSALQRQMDVSGRLGIVPDHADQVIGQILGMGGHEADALYTIHLAHLIEKLCKADGILQPFSVGIDVLSKQHDLAHAVCSQVLRLSQDLPGISASLAPAHIGHDAVTAEVVAAEHDIDAGLIGIFSLDGKILYDPVGLLPDMGRFPVCAVDFPQVLCKAVDIVGAEDQVHEGIALSDLIDVALLLHHAAADRDFHIGIFLFEMADPAQAPEGALVRVVPDRTGVKDDKIRLFGLNRLKSGCHQDPDQLFGISRVHLAPESDCAGSQFTACLGRPVRDQRAESAYIIQLAAVLVRGLRTHKVDRRDLCFQFRVVVHSYPQFCFLLISDPVCRADYYSATL